ncbi:hypothetical protein Bca52824_080305 [Brassica carinata]|uniref:Uncharacterized protein n=1 Tax=Brassica carinata TaxID=52824 RepID=A0A8X7TQI5_BRACI|nr:hypothetical protein Bca52824_080305 [Brassica carinata]
MEAFNEYVVMMEDHVVASRNDKEIESIGSEIKRLSGELKAAKREGKKDAKNIEALTEDWRRNYHENESRRLRSRGIRTFVVLLALIVVISSSGTERSSNL